MIRRISIIANLVLTAGVIALTTALPANAQPSDPPASGDPRATAYSGNATTCEDANLDGDLVTVEFLIDPTNRLVTITSVPSDIELTGTVIKGGPAYNVYDAQHLIALHAPLNKGGNIPEISHWYACGVKKDTTTTTTTTSDTTTTTTSSGTSTTTSDGATTTTTTAAGDGDSDDELADTGFSSGGPLVAGGALLLLGTVLLFAVRRRGLRRD